MPGFLLSPSLRRGALRAGLVAAAVLGVGSLAFAGVQLDVERVAGSHIFTNANSLPAADAILVPGAEIYANGTPSPAVINRMEAALAAYRAGKAQTLLLSGGNGDVEVGAMSRYAVAHGVPAVALLLDRSGSRTYNSCLAARDRFHLRSLIVASQSEHALRTVYICRELGIDASGIVAAEFGGSKELVYHVRERFAIVAAWWDVHRP